MLGDAEFLNKRSFRCLQEAGCQVHAAGKDPFDCNAALNNFFRATNIELE